ncbi:TrmB family transcriptional regulator [Priestia megaterium]|uniref:TrmB family transcriptional regulator n=1 Tax=Priestia megaterium TaxID=1404 RepID=UPI0012B7831E|nr:TrmB family transcriptional regulator [Priestia megaterium]
MLQKFGFSQYESQVYEALLANEGPLDASSIVTYSHVPKAKIYEVLNRLIDKGIVVNTLSGKKKLYSAVALQTVIQKLTADFANDINELKTYKIKKTFTDDHVWSLKDKSSISAHIEQLIHEAESSIILSAWNDELEHYRLLLEEKEKQGVNVEVLTIGNLQTALKHLHTLNPIDDHKNLEPSQLIIVDDAYLLFAGIEHETWKAIKTMSQPLVKVFADFFYHDVALTHITKKYQEQLLQDSEIMELLTRLRY